MRASLRNERNKCSNRTLRSGKMRLKPRIVAAVGRGALPSASELEGADMVEVRMDLAEGDPLKAIGIVRQSAGLPLIATNRINSEGGAFQGSEEKRAELLIEASAYVDFIDIELRAEFRRWLMSKVDLPAIVSYHDFQGTPGPKGLSSILDEISGTGAFIAKIAVTPKSLKDCLDLLELVVESDMPLCVIAMGEIGRHLRAVAPVYGSALTYGYVSEPTAPGQMSVHELKTAMELMGLRI
jgi:3-dehydroquinate dehydratase I